MTPSPKNRRKKNQIVNVIRREMSQKAGFDEEKLTNEENKINIREPKLRCRTRKKNNKTIERKMRDDESKDETPNLLKERNFKIFEKEKKMQTQNQDKIIVHTLKSQNL